MIPIPEYIKIVNDMVHFKHQGLQALNLMCDPSEEDARKRMLEATRKRDVAVMNLIIHEVLQRFEREMDAMIDGYELQLEAERCAGDEEAPRAAQNGALMRHKQTPEA